MARTYKKPPVKETVGALHYCYNIPEEGSTEFTTTYETDVAASKVVKNITVTETGDTVNLMASGEVYDSVSDVTSVDLAVEVIAFTESDLVKMRGDTVTPAGLIKKGGSKERPYFAFGKIVKLTKGHFKWVWYPKCKLVSNTDDANSKEDSFSEQNDTLTIRAFPFNDENEIQIEINSTVKVPTGLTEELFFSKPILTDADIPKVSEG